MRLRGVACGVGWAVRLVGGAAAVAAGRPGSGVPQSVVPSAMPAAAHSHPRLSSCPAPVAPGVEGTSTSYEIAIVVMGSYLAYLVAEVAGACKGGCVGAAGRATRAGRQRAAVTCAARALTPKPVSLLAADPAAAAGSPRSRQA